MESRFKKTRKNLVVQLLYQVTILALGIILPRLIIHTYGSEVNGLTSTIKQIVTLVALAQAGISTAVTYSLYKPVQQRDRIKIAETLYAVKKVFMRVGLIIILAGLAASVVFPFLQSSEIPRSYVFVACFLLCANTAMDLAFTAVYNVYFSATQDKYIISIGFLVAGIVMYGLQLIICVFRLPYILLYACNLCGCIIKIIYFKRIFNIKYKEYALLPGETIHPENHKLNGVGYATLNEVAHSIVTATQTVILSIFCGFAEASIYGVYLLVVDALTLVGQVFYTSFAPSFGSVVAEGDKNKVNSVFQIFQYSYFALNTVLYMCASFLFLPFIQLYTEGADINYINPGLMICFIIYGMFYAYRIPYNITVSVVGAFKKSGIQTGITAIIALAVSIFLVRYEFYLVLVGPIVFYVANTFYQHFMLRKEYDGFDNSHFYRHFIVSVLCISLATALGVVFQKLYMPSNFVIWFVIAIGAAIVSLLLFCVVSFIADRKSMMLTYKFFSSKIHLRR